MVLMPVEEARALILKRAKRLAAETIRLDEGLGRVLASPVKALRDQPPFPASAMDGYAVRASDLAAPPVSLKTRGMSAAGHGFKGIVKSGESVRIFTGAPIPKGADAVIIQENTSADGSTHVTMLQSVRESQNIRSQGFDFKRGEVLLEPGTRLNVRDIGLAGAANAGLIKVVRRPVVAIFATGDELIAPGGRPNADQIISSNSQALVALVRLFGGKPMDLGIVPDKLKATERAVARAAGADILVSTGGASVGDHDFVQQALKNSGVKMEFWKIAMRPGKPFMYGRKGIQHVMGLPGNPVSALVCARLFLKPLIDALLGLPACEELVMAQLGAPMKSNDDRQDYVRAALSTTAEGTRVATPYPKQDSSMQRTFRQSDCLIVRPPGVLETAAGANVPILLIDF